MGWAFCGENDSGREIGYGVKALCDFPGCEEVIDRGLGYLCGRMHDPSDGGCGMYFCERHRAESRHNCTCPVADEE